MKTQIKRLRLKTTSTTNQRRSKGPDFHKEGIVYLNRKNIKTKRPSEKLDYTKLEPFKILEKKGPVIFKLDIPDHIKIHPMFHKSLLEPCHDKNATPYEPVLEEDYHTSNKTLEYVLDAREF